MSNRLTITRRCPFVIPAKERAEKPGKRQALQMSPLRRDVTPAKAGVHVGRGRRKWIPAFAGMTLERSSTFPSLLFILSETFVQGSIAR